MPDYTIIAGPNGAGKSSFSKLLSSPEALIFDADKVKLLKEREWPDIPMESIGIMITTEYWDDFLIKRAIALKDKGFTINLIFLMLPNIKASIDRVNLRVFKKGHFVDNESIKYNFEESLRMLKQHFHKFDIVLLMDASIHSDDATPTTLLKLDNHQISYINPDAPTWAKPHIEHIVQNITTN